MAHELRTPATFTVEKRRTERRRSGDRRAMVRWEPTKADRRNNAIGADRRKSARDFWHG